MKYCIEMYNNFINNIYVELKLCITKTVFAFRNHCELNVKK